MNRVALANNELYKGELIIVIPTGTAVHKRFEDFRMIHCISLLGIMYHWEGRDRTLQVYKCLFSSVASLYS